MRIYYCSVGFSKTFTSTFRVLAIWSRVFKSGCTTLLHHLLTVQADLPTCPANHLLVFSCSARTAFIRFNFAMIVYKDKFWCKDNKILWYKRFYFQLNHKSPYYFFERMVKSYIKHPLFTMFFFFTNCKRTNVDGLYLIHLTLFSMQSLNDKIGKLPLFATLRYVKQIFSF